MPEVSLAHWNSFLATRPDAHLLQTGPWGELKAGFGWEAVRLVDREAASGAQVLFRRLPLGWSIAYIPKGPVAAESGDLWEELDGICRRRRAVLLKVELDLWMGQEGAALPGVLKAEPGFRYSSHNIQPPRTILVDLKGSEEQILARMKQKTRYNIRLAQKKGVSVRPWSDLDAFHRMVMVTGERDAFGVHSRAYYRRAYELFHPGGMAELLLAEHAGSPLAALMVFARGERAWYVYGASTDESRNLMPTYLLQWEAMRWARNKGALEYDLWGVPDRDEEHLEARFMDQTGGLWGVYRFKRGFGGQVRRAVQALDRVYNPFLYRLYEWRMRGREEL